MVGRAISRRSHGKIGDCEQSCEPFKSYHKTYSKKLGGIDNAEEMVKETSECTVRSKIENATNFQKLAYRMSYVICNQFAFPRIENFYQFLLHAVAT